MKTFTKYFGIYVLAVLLGLGLVLLSPTTTEAAECNYVPCTANPGGCDVICMVTIACCPVAPCSPLIKRYVLSKFVNTNCGESAFTFTSCTSTCTPG